MDQKINSFIHTATGVMPYGSYIKLFRRVLMVFLLCNTLFLLSYSEILYGVHSYFIPFDASNNFILRALSLLEKPQFAMHWKWFVGGQILSILACLLLPYKRVATLFVYFFTMSLYYKTIPVQNAGFNLLVMVLFMLIFMDENADNTRQPNLRTLNITVTNFAFWTARFQVIMLYIAASWFKLFGQTWKDGTAFYYVLFTDTYTQPFVRDAMINNSFMIHAISWFAFGFQLLFPLLVWFNKTKPVILALGVLFHVMIILVMGIVDFGLIMLIMYLLFVPKQYFARFPRLEKLF